MNLYFRMTFLLPSLSSLRKFNLLTRGVRLRGEGEGGEGRGGRGSGNNGLIKDPIYNRGSERNIYLV